MLGGGGLNFHLHLDVKLHLECGKNMGAGGDLQEKGPTLHLTESPPPTGLGPSGLGLATASRGDRKESSRGSTSPPFPFLPLG